MPNRRFGLLNICISTCSTARICLLAVGPSSEEHITVSGDKVPLSRKHTLAGQARGKRVRRVQICIRKITVINFVRSIVFKP